MGSEESIYRGVTRLYPSVKGSPISWERPHEPPLNEARAVVAAWFDQEFQRHLIRPCHNISFNAVQVRKWILENLDWDVDGGLRWFRLVEENRYQAVYFSFMLNRFGVSIHLSEWRSSMTDNLLLEGQDIIGAKHRLAGNCELHLTCTHTAIIRFVSCQMSFTNGLRVIDRGIRRCVESLSNIIY